MPWKEVSTMSQRHEKKRGSPSFCQRMTVCNGVFRKRTEYLCDARRALESFQGHKQQRNGRGGNAGNSRSLPHGGGSDP